jgi:hypothetical protein
MEDKGGSNNNIVVWFSEFSFLRWCLSKGLNRSLFSSSSLPHIPLICLYPSGQPIRAFFRADSFWSTNQSSPYNSSPSGQPNKAFFTALLLLF